LVRGVVVFIHVTEYLYPPSTTLIQLFESSTSLPSAEIIQQRSKYPAGILFTAVDLLSHNFSYI